MGNRGPQGCYERNRFFHIRNSIEHYFFLAGFFAAGFFVAGFFAAMVSALCCVPSRADYRTKAEETMAFIQEQFYDARAGLYRPATPADPKPLP